MEIATVNCTSCGAPIKIPADLEHFNCAFCGAGLAVQRGEGYIALKLAEQVSKSIQDVGDQTKSTIREGTEVTQIELKRLQLSQEISSLQIQLSTIQSEIRALQRQQPDLRIAQQLKDLSRQEISLINRIKALNTPAVQTYPAQESVQPKVAEKPRESPAPSVNKTSSGLSSCFLPVGRGCLSGCLVSIAGAIVCGIPAQALDQAIFKIPMDATSSGSEVTGPVFSAIVYFLMVATFVGFVFGLNPKAMFWKSAWNWMGARLGKERKQVRTQAASVQAETEGGVSGNIGKPEQ